MVFNDTTNKLGIVQDIDFLVFGDTQDHSTEYPLADKVRNVNRWYQRVISWIFEASDEWEFDDKNNTDYPIATCDLVKDQQDYPLPITLLKIHRVEVCYDGTNWYKAQPFDIGERGRALSTTKIKSDFSKSEPYYDVMYNAIWLYPIPDQNVSSGLKIWFTREVINPFSASDTDKQPGFDEQFHRILSLGAAYDYCLANGNPKATILRQEIELMKEELKKFYGEKQEDRTYQLKIARPNYK